MSGVLRLRDGVCVRVREIRLEDAAALRRLVGRSSERSVELRFFGPMRELTEEKARRFAEVDGRGGFALVEDRFQGRGLGLGLTRRLIEAAKKRGIGRLHVLVLPENRGMLRLLSSLEFPERRRRENGLEHIEVELSSDAA